MPLQVWFTFQQAIFLGVLLIWYDSDSTKTGRELWQTFFQQTANELLVWVPASDWVKKRPAGAKASLCGRLGTLRLSGLCVYLFTYTSPSEGTWNTTEHSRRSFWGCMLLLYAGLCWRKLQNFTVWMQNQQGASHKFCFQVYTMESFTIFDYRILLFGCNINKESCHKFCCQANAMGSFLFDIVWLLSKFCSHTLQVCGFNYQI
jgi:hypothetical protein